jgi:hypothetical protein
MGNITMELRHLRYFIAVAEEGSLTNAAERRLHTAQPSLSRQIRDLELEVGVKLLERKTRGITLTAAGRVFLDHARLALMQIEVAGEAARSSWRGLPSHPENWCSKAINKTVMKIVVRTCNNRLTWGPHKSQQHSISDSERV